MITEEQLRKQVADVMLSWVGATRGSTKHLEILRIYNSYRPLARNYTVQVGDAYCATTASAAYIYVGIAKWTGTECGVDPWVRRAQELGIWIENDAHAPLVGEACVYDWEDAGVGDNGGYPDHIGIVVEVKTDGSFVVAEGNMSGGRVGLRPMQINGRYIRGFIAPDFAKIAAEMNKENGEDPSKKETQKTMTRDEILAVLGDKWIGKFADLPEWAQPEVRELIEMGALKGTQEVSEIEDTAINGTLNNMIRPMIVSLRISKAMARILKADEENDPKEAVAEVLQGILTALYAN